MTGAKQIGVVAVLRRLFRGQRRRLVALVALSCLGGLAQAGVLVILANVGVGIAAGEDSLRSSLGLLGSMTGSVPRMLVLAALVLVVVVVADVVGGVISARMSVDVLTRERSATYDAYAWTSAGMQARERDGHLQELLSKNAGWSGTAMNSATAAIVAGCNIMVLTVSAVVVEPIVAVAMAAAGGLLVIFARPLGSAVRRETRVASKMNIDFANLISRNVSLSHDIRYFDVGEVTTREVNEEIGRLSAQWFRIRLLSRLGPALFRSSALLLVIVAIAGVHYSGQTALATLGAVVLIFLRALSYAGALQRGTQEIHGAMPWLEQLWQRRSQLESRRIAQVEGQVGRLDHIRFANVSFSYVVDETATVDARGGCEPSAVVLAGVEFEFLRGETIGLVGPSGAGKSTLVKLLLRLHAPTAGRILVDGRDVESSSLSDWYSRVGYVPQHIHTFSGSVADNIAFFRPWVTEEQIEEAARRAHLHDEVLALPHGYSTNVGERDGRLSGGQRQRLALARALVSKPELLILDEPTSALDLRSEESVQNAIHDLGEDTTSLIVAHRLSTLSSCQRIMVLEGGELTAFDTPERVCGANEFFREATRLARA